MALRMTEQRGGGDVGRDRVRRHVGVRDGALEKLKARMRRLVDFVEVNEPRILAYNVIHSGPKVDRDHNRRLAGRRIARWIGCAVSEGVDPSLGESLGPERPGVIGGADRPP
jgi:hypothetical protein